MVTADTICSQLDAAGVCHCECITSRPQEIYTAVNLMEITPISSLYSGMFVSCESLERYMYFRVKCRATGLERLWFSVRCTLRIEASLCGQQQQQQQQPP
jgi:hypothetical protein